MNVSGNLSGQPIVMCYKMGNMIYFYAKFALLITTNILTAFKINHSKFRFISSNGIVLTVTQFVGNLSPNVNYAYLAGSEDSNEANRNTIKIHNVEREAYYAITGFWYNNT
jgi:hypothetical protein